VWIITRLADHLHDRVSTSVDGPVLSLDDRLDSGRSLDFSRKGWKGRNQHDHLEVLAVFCGRDDTFRDSGSDLIPDRMTWDGRRDEELVLDVDSVVGFPDLLDIRI
jgi:hypothetical protein